MSATSPIQQGNRDLHPAPNTSRYVQANGLRFHLLDYGTEGKRPLLCLHGGGAHAHWFDLVASEFTRDYHVLALDQRGHGDSAWAEPPIYTYTDYVADLAKVIETLDLREFVLLGHSMGGMVSLLYASGRPQRVKALIVVDSNLHMTQDLIAGMNTRGQHPGRSFATLEDYVAKYKLRPLETMADQATIDYIARHSARQFEDGRWRHKLDRRAMATRTPMEGVPLWKNIHMPALLVKAQLSKRVSPEILAETRVNCVHVEVVEVSRSEHHVTLDNPGEFAQVVRRFLDRL